ncbi:MAG: hypothetical protein HYW25_05440 [Candidatus Aenigmarchaeota archaeon]|nr:hypothetical protein [Candidatus Aenigmarchaeota archaeon]
MNAKFLPAILITLALSVSAYALSVDFDQRHQIVPISTEESTNTVMISGTALDALDEYTYEVIGPGGTQIMNGTGALNDSLFSITIEIPTADDFTELGVPAAGQRAAIPMHVLITFTDANETNETQRFHAHVVVATNLFDVKIQNMIKRLENIAEHAERLEVRLERLSEKAAAKGLNETAAALFGSATQAHLVAESAEDLIEKIEALGIGAFEADDLRNALIEFREEFREMHQSLREIRNVIGALRRGG